jgi:hypothetical protein
MTYQVLTESDVEQFIERGYIRLKEAYPRQAALDAQDFLWDRIIEKYPEYGLKKDDPETWAPVLKKDGNGSFPTIHMREFYNDAPSLLTRILTPFRRDLPGDGEVVGVRAVLKVLDPAQPSPL